MSGAAPEDPNLSLVTCSTEDDNGLPANDKVGYLGFYMSTVRVWT